MSDHSFSWYEFEGVDCSHRPRTLHCAACRREFQAFMIEYQRLGPIRMRMKIWWIKLSNTALRLWVGMLGLFLKFLKAIAGSS